MYLLKYAMGDDILESTKSIQLRKFPTINEMKPYCKSFLESVVQDDELLVYLRNNYLSIYHNGNLYAKIEGSGNLIMMGESYKKYFLEDDNNWLYDELKRASKEKRFELYQQYSSELKKVVYKGLPKQIERKYQQKIARQHYRQFDGNKNLIICDFEFTLEEIFTLKSAEVDLVAIDVNDIDKPVVYLIEYKCTTNALKEKPNSNSKSSSGILGHYQDFSEIHEAEKKGAIKAETAIKEGAITSYNFLLELGALEGPAIDPEIDLDCVSFKYGFLFTDLKESQYKGYLKKIAKDDDLDVKVWHFDTPEQVVLAGVNNRNLRTYA